MIEQLTLVPSRGGVFEVQIDDDLVFSKKALRRHVEPGELVHLLDERVGPNVERYPQS